MLAGGMDQEYQVSSSVKTEALSCSKNHRMYSKSFLVVGSSIGRAKYLQHFAVQYSQRYSPGLRSARVGRLGMGKRVFGFEVQGWGAGVTVAKSGNVH
jgi:hypothetical protein